MRTHILTNSLHFCLHHLSLDEHTCVYASLPGYMRSSTYGIRRTIYNVRCVVPPWASYGELHEVEQRLARVKADLISELVAVRVFSLFISYMLPLPSVFVFALFIFGLWFWTSLLFSSLLFWNFGLMIQVVRRP